MGGQGALSRFSNEQSLTVSFPQSADRYLRLRVLNRDGNTLHPGPDEAQSPYQSKPEPLKPWSERHPGILYFTHALAVASMAGRAAPDKRGIAADLAASGVSVVREFL